MSERLRRFLESDSPAPAPTARRVRAGRRQPCGAGYPTGALTRSAAAEYLRVHWRTVRRLEKQGRLVPQRTTQDRPYYTQAQLEAFLKTWRPGQHAGTPLRKFLKP
jgi:hypothetical protein